MDKLSNVDRLTNTQLQESRTAWWSDQFTGTLVRLLGPLNNQIILDVGCGLGILSQKLRSVVSPQFSIIGIDLDLSRLRGQDGVAAAGADKLPFSSATFTSAVSILTLQHIPQREAVLAEMRRVVRPGGLLLVAEADNLDQKMYFAASSHAFGQAYAAFWQAIARNTPTVDFSLGPKLMNLFRTVGLPEPKLEGFLVSLAKQSKIKDIRDKFLLLAERYHLTASQEFQSLLAIVDEFQPGEGAILDVISTVPLFLVSARVADI